MNLFRTIANIILPPRCLKCGKILARNNGLCPQCFSEIRFISAPLCYKCGRPFDTEAALNFADKQYCGACMQKKKSLLNIQRSAFIYDDNSKKLILDFKFHDQTAFAETLAGMLYAAGSDIWNEHPDLLIPVPLHRWRLLKRRYNQSALLAGYLSRKTSIKTDYTTLIRQENTIPQVQLTGSARRKNLRHAFCVSKPQKIIGKRIVLIDDVSTTGSTLNECAKVLLRAGAAAVYSLTLARGDS